MKEVIIIGGGLAGLVSAILLNRLGRKVAVFEKSDYPAHKVCGEYISNEVKPFLKHHGLLPEVRTPGINTLLLSDTKGKSGYTHLKMGGFGVSRFYYDRYLYELALSEGIEIKTGEPVSNITFKNDLFTIKTLHQDTHQAQVIIGAFGKRSNLDKTLDRSFFKKRSPYVGVKYHARTDHPDNLIVLHNFEGGYCGVNNVEHNITNICYLVHRDKLKQSGDINKLEKEVLFNNPHIKKIFAKSEFLFDGPKVINEISFETKVPVENHILMCGDAAGMITPLCGNGMAMAIHSAKIASETVNTYFTHPHIGRKALEKQYAHLWSTAFKKRLWIGRNMQKLFGNQGFSNMAVGVINNIKPLGHLLIKSTHGGYIEWAT